MNHSISIIVATKDRPSDLQRLLASLTAQSRRPDQIVIVDASKPAASCIACEFPALRIDYKSHWPPSAAAQRNVGIRAADPSSTLIGFVDDDTTFEPDAFAAMLQFWDSTPDDVLGASFNIQNYRLPRGQSFKRSSLVASLGLYSATPGGIAPSGWQSVTGHVSETQFVDWLPSGAAVWRREVLAQHVFDEYFDSYSYLEDLDLSYSIGRKGKLVIVAEAGYSHYPSRSGRISARQFGRLEVRNRLYFVRKHGLCTRRCLTAIAVRSAMTVVRGVSSFNRAMLARAAGNLQGLWEYRRSRSLSA